MVLQFSIKHRAREFKDLHGQEQIQQTLIKRVKANNWPKAMLLAGPYGTGKTTTAFLIAQHLQCKSKDADGNPCGECSSCKSILSERFDRDTVMLDGSQLSGKDAVIEFTSTLNIKPMYDKNRIYIIEEADQLSTAAINALLKVLEQPQANVYFILLSMQNNGIPPAIKSRCQTFNFKPVSVKDTMFFLKSILEKENLWDALPDEFRLSGLSTIASASRGSLREAIQYLEQCIVGEYYTVSDIEGILTTVDEVRTYKIVQALLSRSKDASVWTSIYATDPAELYNYLTVVLSDAAIYAQTRYVKDERFLSDVKSIANNTNSRVLLRILVEGNQFMKPYIRRADLLSALALYYETTDSPQRLAESESIPVRRVVK